MNIFVLIRKSLYKLIYLFDQLIGNQPKVFVLCYHSISNDWLYGVKAAEFKKQINYLERYYNFISPKQLADHLRGKSKITYPAVLITFDDGYEDILQIKGFLKSKRIKPLLFLLADPKNANRAELATEKKLLSKSQVLQLINMGWEIGSHGQTHVNFGNMDNSSVRIEIADSKKDLHQKFSISVKYFAYPKGRYNKQIIKQVKASKYELAFSMDDGFIDQQTNKFTIPRVGINQSHSLTEFKSLFSPSVVQFRRFCKFINLERAFT